MNSISTIVTVFEVQLLLPTVPIDPFSAAPSGNQFVHMHI